MFYDKNDTNKSFSWSLLGKWLKESVIITISLLILIILSTQTLGALTTDLVAYWNFDNNNLTSGVNNFTFTNSGTTNGSGIIGSGRFMDTGDNLLTDNSIPITGAMPHTINFWFKNNGSATGIVFYSWGSASASKMKNAIYTNTTHLSYDSFSNALYSTPTNMTNGEWTMKTFVYKGGYYNSTNVDVYENGIKVTTIGTSTNPLNIGSSQMYIGRYINGAVAGINGTVDEFAMWNRTLNSTEINALWNSSSGCTYPFTNDCVVSSNNTPSWFNQTPSDLNTTNVIGTRTNISYYYPDANISSSTPFLNYTVTNAYTYINGSLAVSGYITENYSYNLTGGYYSFLLDDNDILRGATYNINENIMESTTHSYTTIANTNQYRKIELLNVNTSTPYNYFELMLNATGNIQVYYCNSSYSTGSVVTNSNCAILGTINSTGFNHSHGSYNAHNVFSLPINNTGYFSTVKVTSTSYFIVRGSNTGNGYLYYINNNTRTRASQSSADNGNVWTNENLLYDAHLHQFSGGSVNILQYAGCYTNTSGTTICSNTTSDNIDVTILPPSSAKITYPTNTTEVTNGENVTITWIEGVPFNSSISIGAYNLSLLNNDDSLNTDLGQANILTTVTTTDDDDRTSSSYGLVSEITIPSRPIINNVTTRTKVGSGDTGSIIIGFCYKDGFCANTSEQNVTATTYKTYNFTNPYLLKEVISISEYTKVSGAHIYTANLTALYVNNNASSWIVNISAIGYYKIKITATDEGNRTAYSISEPFLLSSKINITGTNAYTGANLSNFSGWIYNVASGWNQTYSDTNGSAYISLLSGLNMIYFDSYGYSINSSSNYYNLTINTTPSIYSHSFSLYTENSIYLSIFDEASNTLITQNISIELQYLNATLGYYFTSSGHYFYENLTDGEYLLIIQGGAGVNYTRRDYTVTVASRSTQTLNAFLIGSGTTMTTTIRESLTGGLLEGATVSMYRNINNTWQLVEIKSSDITGKTQFSYIANQKYRFIVQNSGYVTKQFDLDPILYENYDVMLTRQISYNYTGDMEDIKITYRPLMFFANESTDFIFVITSPDGTLEDYEINLSYPCGSINLSGNNSIGENFNETFSITCASFRDTLNITYCYDTVYINSPKCYMDKYFISGASSSNNYTFIKNLRRDYGLGDFEKVLFVTILILIFAGVTYAIAGFSASIVMILIIMGVFTSQGFISGWIFIPTLVAGLFLIFGFRER